MDPVLARRLENDDDFSEKLVKLVRDYLQLGQSSLNYWLDEFDAAHDILMCYAPLTKKDFDSLERGHPKRFVLPMTATQITTMTTFIAQSLFGDASPHKVEPRGPEDEVPAEHMNQLLRWSSEQQPTYLLGYLWIQDILTYNRGIMYNTWAPLWETKMELVEAEDPGDPDESGAPKKYSKPKRTRKETGGYCKIHLVSPYDFFCDPSMPLHRMQEGRFTGHRTQISWQELHRRSKLEPTHPSYVSPKAVEALKEKHKNKSGGGTTSILGPATGAPASGIVSRTAYERTRSATPAILPQNQVNKEDPGVCDTFELWMRLIPSDADLYDSDEQVILQVLVANNDVVLSVDESTYLHDEYPYSVAQGRPDAYLPFSPGWVIFLKAIQDYVDYLKNRHQEAVSRTLGNIFIAKTDKVNLADFLNPDKEGLIIPVLPEATGEKLDDIIRQVPINDQTKDFTKEMMDFVTFSETVTGANVNMQGQVTGEGSATEYAGTQQMSAGRMASIARMVSVQGLVPQTKQFVANFQQFLTNSMVLRFQGNEDTAMKFRGIQALTITPEIIQGKFDFIAHDGTLPGTDVRKVAAMSKLLEAAEAFPQFFEPAPGNIDGRAILLAMAKAASVPVDNFLFNESVAQPPPVPGNGPLPPGGPPPPPGGLPPVDLGPPPVGPGPGRPPITPVDSLPSIEPPQIRPANA